MNSMTVPPMGVQWSWTRFVDTEPFVESLLWQLTLNSFSQTGRRALDVLAMPDPPVTRDVHKGGRHDASGVQAVECDRTALL